jgi:hypothetical protein
MGPIVENARVGVVQPIWSPCIIAEGSRLLAWKHFRDHPGNVSTSQWRGEFSDRAKRWFAWVSEVFEVVEDRPPYEPQWTAEPTDPWDQPVWTAAVRSRAVIVVTENLKDGPPPDSRGIRQYRDIRYLHPNFFVDLMDIWADLMWESRFPQLEAGDIEPASSGPEVPAGMRQTINEILRQADFGTHDEPPDRV